MVKRGTKRRPVARRTTAQQATRRLREAFAQGDLTLFLGAGCSVASHVPTWDDLVMLLYINGVARHLHRFTSTPSLVFSVGQWASARRVLPLDVAARKLRGYYRNDSDLMLMLELMLYGTTGYLYRDRLKPEEIRELLAANPTLRAIARLCRNSVPGSRGVRAIVSYNYDDLLEKSLGRLSYQSVWRATAVKPKALPIFHVHGFVPAGDRRRGSDMDEILLTEDQYNRVMQNPYSWQNLVQINALSSSVALMIGLSLSDRDLRSLLDALRNLPQPVEAYALMRRPQPWALKPSDVDSIVEEMKARIRGGWEFVGDRSAAEKDIDKPEVRAKVAALVRELEKRDLKQEEAMLAELGVRTIWYDDHSEIEPFVAQIIPPARRSSGGARRPVAGGSRSRR